MKEEYGIHHCAIKMTAYPNHQQEKVLFANIHTSRFIYNQLNANSWYDTQIKKVNKKYPIPENAYKYNKKGRLIKKSTKRATGLDRALANKPAWFDDLPLDSDMFYNTEVNYKAAWHMFYQVHDAGTPKFKCRDRCKWSYTTSNHYSSQRLAKMGEKPNIYNGAKRFKTRSKLYLGKTLGSMRVSYGDDIKLPSRKRNIRISKITFTYLRSGKWQISVLFKSPTPFKQKLPKTGKQVGIDLNIENFLTDSNGLVVANPKFYKTALHRLKQEQRKLSRMQRHNKQEGRKLRDCKNYQKQRQKVAKIHQHIKNQRENFVNVLSAALIKNHDLVVSENLQSKNMLKNHALAQSISDAGWRSLIEKLKYKAKMYGRIYIAVDPKFTTQRCHNCGYRMGSEDHPHKLTLEARKWWCPKCGCLHVRDWNAAINILQKGIKYLATQLPVYNVYVQ